MFFILGMWMFLTAMEVYENACDLPPAAETVAVTRAVDEESRDVRAGVLRYLIKLTIHAACSVKWIINKLLNISKCTMYPLFFFYLCDGFYNRGINHLSFSRGSLRAHTMIHI